jgi:hypothetical protein
MDFRTQKIKRLKVIFCSLLGLLAAGILANKYFGTREVFWVTWKDVKTGENRESCDRSILSGDSLDGIGYTMFLDEESNWSGRIVQREIFVHGPNHNLLYTTKGPMAPSGRPHGEWVTIHCARDASGDFPPSKYQWYWYGEEISEAKWHELIR